MTVVIEKIEIGTNSANYLEGTGVIEKGNNGTTEASDQEGEKRMKSNGIGGQNGTHQTSSQRTDQQEPIASSSKSPNGIVRSENMSTKTVVNKVENSQQNSSVDESNNFSNKFIDEDFASVEDSHFIYYLITFAIILTLLYIGAHNKKKILGLLIEGRKSANASRRSSIRYKRLSQSENPSEKAASSSYRDTDPNIIY
ncbi:unnamed protein product [Anisakis simplex]|uniref:Trans-Golgi network integral membrane protein 2 n=1 Tax=Anisakis simplex TaxID=6269 RepID=A0A0M3JWB3_ANISI|nr:unnamed protein product [Anisakis simplex]